MNWLNKIKLPKISKYTIFEFTAPFIGFLISLFILLIIVVLVGESPLNAIVAVANFCFGSTARVFTILSIAIPLYLAGLATATAFRAGIFNIGVEGQYLFGGFIGALAGIYLPLPAFLHIPAVVLFAMLGGALWALIPALLKVKKGIHEVISTIMFNNIALAFLNYLVNGPFSGIKGTSSLEPQTLKILPTALFGKLNWIFQGIGLSVPDHVYLDYSLVVAILIGFFMWFLLRKTRYGFEMKGIGASLSVSEFAGIKVGKVQIWAFLLSGGIAGLVGLQEIFAIRGFYTFSVAQGLGFDGIAIALIGKNSPIGVIFAALLFAFLRQAGYGLQFSTSVPNSVINVITGLMILIIVVINELVTRYIQNLRRKEGQL